MTVHLDLIVFMRVAAIKVHFTGLQKGGKDPRQDLHHGCLPRLAESQTLSSLSGKQERDFRHHTSASMCVLDSLGPSQINIGGHKRPTQGLAAKLISKPAVYNITHNK